MQKREDYLHGQGIGSENVGQERFLTSRDRLASPANFRATRTPHNENRMLDPQDSRTRKPEFKIFI